MDTHESNYSLSDHLATFYTTFDEIKDSKYDGMIITGAPVENLEYEDVDPRLSEMENPYDPQARKELGIYYHWDHAFYNGKYYMYFGIVPVVL